MQRLNNFDGLRLMAAFSVMFTHAFVIAEGNQQREPFVVLSGYQCPIGLIGVFVFFIISGYLVTQSWFSTGAVVQFAVKRVMRIFPGLIVNLLFCAFIFGPSLTILSMSDYLHGPELIDFLQRNIMLESGDIRLPGVIILDNEAGATINGSLWTLRYEIMMYVMLGLLGCVRLIRLTVILGAVAAGVLAIYFEKHLNPLGDLGEAAWFLGFFAGGMAGYLLRDTGWFGWKMAAIGLSGLVVSTELHWLIMLFPIFGTLLTLGIARAYFIPALNVFSRFGDLSFGVYIYGWPVEAWVAHTGGGSLTWWQVLLSSIPPTLMLAFLSWHGIEKHAIRFGRDFGRLRQVAATS